MLPVRNARSSLALEFLPGSSRTASGTGTNCTVTALPVQVLQNVLCHSITSLRQHFKSHESSTSDHYKTK